MDSHGTTLVHVCIYTGRLEAVPRLARCPIYICHFQPGSILAGAGSIPEEREAPEGTPLNGYGPQTTPGDAARKIRTKGLIIQIRGSDGHVHCAPRDVRQAAVPHIARTEVLEVAVDARGAFVLTSAISSASNDVVGAEAHTTQLPCP